MLLIRLLLLMLVAWIGWRIWRLLAAPSAGTRPPPVEDMVRCAHCAVHLPRGQAVQDGDAWYCCEAHRAEHLAGR